MNYIYMSETGLKTNKDFHIM